MTDRPRFAWPNGARAAVSLTFDDARPSQLDIGLPILDGLGGVATFYVSIDPLTRRLHDWVRASRSGHEIGNHSLRHPCSANFGFDGTHTLEDYSLERMETELVEANREVERLTGVAPRTFAYPCGQKYVGRGEQCRSYVPIVARLFLAGRGFRDEAPNRPEVCDLAQLMAIDGDQMPPDEAMRWIDRAVAVGGWLVLVGHDIGDGGRQVFLRQTLEAVCRRCGDPNGGAWLATVAAAALRLQRSRTPAHSP